MAPLELEGDTLGKKHQYYNKLVRESLSTTRLLEPAQGDDIQSLLNIDIASKNRNVDYILEVMKSEDQLYVSKAIKRSIWLFTDPQYAHIINIEHLYTEFYSQMTLKAFNKLMLNIRLHLKDETRVEYFYNCIKEKDTQSAYKWLQHCSVPFVKIEVAKYYQEIPRHIVLRLFKKSFSIFEKYISKWKWIVRECIFLLRNHTDEYLDILESIYTMKDWFTLDFSAKDTETVMKKCPKRIVDKFEFYGTHLNIATFAKYLNKEENIHDFLLKYAKDEKFQWLFSHCNIQNFIKRLPRENRFEFVKKVFIDKETLLSRDTLEDDLCAISAAYNTQRNTSVYQWYKFAPFDTAFNDLKKLIRTESVPAHRNAMLLVLLSCVGRNIQRIQTLLQYYYDKHFNEPFKFKIQFVNFFISKVDTHSLDDKTWDVLNKLFHSMEVYIDSENNVQSCIKAIIVRSAIRNEQVPDIIKNKFVFDTLKSNQSKLEKQEEKDAVFKYLHYLITTKSNSHNLTVESEFNDAVNTCEEFLNLINDWGKELHDHPHALEKVKELIKAKQENNWKRDLTSLYYLKKSWRKTMFEESIAILPTEEVCVNALKHDPGLLFRNKEQVLSMCCNDNVSLKKLLKKIRIYWPHTLAKDWRMTYLKRLEQPGGHKAVVVGLCILLPHEQIEDLLKKYAPSGTKIDWNETDQLKLSLRKQIAKNIHIARPQPSVEGILLYAKGDYLQYAVPSINAILSQMSPNKSRNYVSILLDSPVSLQKFGVRFAFKKLTCEELNPMLLKIWNSAKNSSIRTVLFTHTFQLLCEQKNSSQIKKTWDLLSMFIDKLTPDENKLIYKQLGEVYNVPDSIKPQFYKKSYIFLNSLPAKCNCESILNDMQGAAKGLMEFLDDDFVVNVMLMKFHETLITEQRIYNIAGVISTFILTSKDEKTQIKRYEISLATLLDKYLPQWDKIEEGKYRVKEHIKTILDRLADNLSSKYTFEEKLHIPLKVFQTIQIRLEKSLTYEKDYVTLTMWKLMVAFVKILDDTKPLTVYYEMEADDKTMTNEEMDKMYTDTQKKIASLFIKTCLQFLKEDSDRFGSSIYTLFSQALSKVFTDYLARSMCTFEDQIDYFLSFLQNDNGREVWLMVHTVLDAIPNTDSESERKKFEEVRETVFSHPSNEVKMHYYDLFDYFFA